MIKLILSIVLAIVIVILFIWYQANKRRLKENRLKNREIRKWNGGICKATNKPWQFLTYTDDDKVMYQSDIYICILPADFVK